MKLDDGYFKVIVIDLKDKFSHIEVSGNLHKVLAQLLDVEDFDIFEAEDADRVKDLTLCQYEHVILNRNGYFGYYPDVSLDMMGFVCMLTRMTISDRRITKCIEYSGCTPEEIWECLNRLYVRESATKSLRAQDLFLNFSVLGKYTHCEVECKSSAGISEQQFKLEVIDIDSRYNKVVSVTSYWGTIIELLGMLFGLDKDNIPRILGEPITQYDRVSLSELLRRAERVTGDCDCDVSTLAHMFKGTIATKHKIVTCMGRTRGVTDEQIDKYVDSLSIVIEKFVKIGSYYNLHGLHKIDIE